MAKNGAKTREHTIEKAFGSSEGHVVRGPGPVEGAGEVATGSPGRATRRFNGTTADQGGEPAAVGKNPRGMSNDESGDDE
jgi:hypothetical protein